MKVGFGYSFNDDSYMAGREAVKKALEISGAPALAIVFNTYNYYQEDLLKGVKELIPSSKIVGFSGEGIIISDKIYKKGVGIITLSGEELKVETFLEEKKDIDDYSLGEFLGRKILKTGISKGTIFVFSDPSEIDVPFFLHGLYNILGKEFNFIGAGVGRIAQEVKVFAFTEEGMVEGGVSLAVLDGIDINIAFGHGWAPIGDPLIISRTKGREIFEIDGKSALSTYKEKIGEFPEDEFIKYATENPLGFPNLLGNFFIRDPMGIGEKESLLFLTKVYAGSVGYIMKGDIIELISTAKTIGEKAVKNIEKPEFAIIFDCISRSYYMGENFERELKAVKESFPYNIPILGILTFGEIAGFNKIPSFHNKTLMVAVGGGKGEEGREGRSYPLYAELSILHEISAFSLPESEKELYEEIGEKVGRFFDLQLFALLLKTEDSYKLVSSWGFKNEEEVFKVMGKEKPNQFKFPLGEGELGIIFVEQKYSVESKEKKIYTIFGRKIEELLREFQNIKKQKEFEERLKSLSLTDELTGLYNRRGFLTLAEQQLKISERIGKRSILIYIDLDYMKWINDTFGHKEGDKYLMDFANILKRSFRKSDIIARIGGDEFVILCLEATESSIEKLLSRLYKNIEIYNSTKNKPYKMSISAGFSFYTPKELITINELLHIADQRMYKEKMSKKNKTP